MKVLDFKNEDGFWAAFFVIFLVTLGLVAVGGAVLMQAEGINLGHQATMVQVDYAMDGAVQYAIRALENDEFENDGSLTVGSITMSLDTVHLAGGEIELNVSASVGNMLKNSTLNYTMAAGLSDYALYTTKTASKITFRDHDGNVSDAVDMQNAPSMPTIDETALINASNAQGNSQAGAWIAPDHHPDPALQSFYNAAGQPHVTYVNGVMEVPSGRTVYGIFFVTGSVVLRSFARIEGVVYMPNHSAAANLGLDTSSSRIIGGVVTNGAVEGGWFFNSVIQHNRDYMSIFASNETGDPIPGQVRIQSWARK